MGRTVAAGAVPKRTVKTISSMLASTRTEIARHGTCTPKVFNRVEFQYGTYRVKVWDYWWGEEGGEILEGDMVLE